MFDVSIFMGKKKHKKDKLSSHTLWKPGKYDLNSPYKDSV